MPHQQWKHLGNAEYTRLNRQWEPDAIREIVRCAEGRLMYETLNATAREESDRLLRALREQYQPGAALMILRAAHRTASYAEKKMKKGHLATEHIESAEKPIR
jgi:uncharacterized lipoprotein YehR (DUF1307 family)